MSTEKARDYFNSIANLGMTRHYGSMEATRKRTRSWGSRHWDSAYRTARFAAASRRQAECPADQKVGGAAHRSRRRPAAALMAHAPCR